MSEQLSLPLPTRPALGRDHFYVSPANAVALEAVENPATWPSGRLAVVGPAGSGKTHLAHVYAATGASVVRPDNLRADTVDSLAQGSIAMDDADKVTDETALFHLMNLLDQRGFSILLTSTRAPANWQVGLPDLASRLSAVTMVEIGDPDDALLTAVLAKHFSDRGIRPAPRLIPYILARMDRSLASAGRIVAQLDAEALAQRKPIGLRLAALVLDKTARPGA